MTKGVKEGSWGIHRGGQLEVSLVEEFQLQCHALTRDLGMTLKPSEAESTQVPSFPQATHISNTFIWIME
jgi:hypothetical protein